MQNLVNSACQILTEVSRKQQSVQKNFNNLCDGKRGNFETRKYFKGKAVRGNFKGKQKFCSTMNNNYQKKKKKRCFKNLYIILFL